MTNKDYRGIERELVPGTLRGFRQFRLVRREDSIFIRSPQQTFIWDEPLKWQKAFCHKNLSVCYATCLDCYKDNPSTYPTPPKPLQELKKEYNISSRKCLCSRIVKIGYKERDSRHTPNRYCHCGFYAAYNLLSLSGASGISWSVPYQLDMAVGVVEAAGRIQLGTQGFQAEKMRIVSLYVDYFNHYTVEERNWLQKNANAHGDFKKMVKEYPPDDLSQLGIKTSLPPFYFRLPNRLIQLLGLSDALANKFSPEWRNSSKLP